VVRVKEKEDQVSKAIMAPKEEGGNRL
jgi:hypothetical protein